MSVTPNPELGSAVDNALDRMENAMKEAMRLSEGMLELQVTYDSGIQANNKAGQTFGKIQ